MLLFKTQTLYMLKRINISNLWVISCLCHVLVVVWCETTSGIPRSLSLETVIAQAGQNEELSVRQGQENCDLSSAVRYSLKCGCGGLRKEHGAFVVDSVNIQLCNSGLCELEWGNVPAVFIDTQWEDMASHNGEICKLSGEAGRKNGWDLKFVFLFLDK